jgi:SPP1 gp7 family putative phage head morphogenesis protein
MGGIGVWFSALRRPSGGEGVLDFDAGPVPGISFNLEPEAAIEFMRAKKLRVTFDYRDMIAQEHVKAFTVAKMMQLDLLHEVHQATTAAIAKGTSFEFFKAQLEPTLQAAGWWGRQAVIDPKTGAVVTAQLGSPWRLATIFRSNIQSAYSVGHWQQIAANAKHAPWLLYDAIDDARTRPEHAALDGLVVRADSPFWKTHFPPNGYNCRCSVIQLTSKQLAALGKTPTKPEPKIKLHKWTNPRTGKTYNVPDGIDPSWAHNPGLTSQTDVKALLAEKVEAMPKALRDAAKASIKQQAAQLSAAAATAAQKALAKETGERMLARSIARAADTAAAAALKAIESGSTPDPGNWLKIALAKLTKAGAPAYGSQKELLDAVTTTAASLKAHHAHLSALSSYSKAVISGKTPTKAQAAAFAAATDAQKTATLAKIDAAKTKAEKAAAEAVKASPVSASNLTGGALDTSADNMTKIGPQKGSNPGGLYQDTDTGVKWYIKTPQDPQQARSEVLAAKLYELAGVEVPEYRLTTLNGKVAVASRFIEGTKHGTLKELAKTAGAAEGFIADAWLANWDVVGALNDNMVIKAGRVIRLDTGGALRYRAQGALKGAAFNDNVPELETLSLKNINAQTAAVFEKASDEVKRAATAKLAAITDEQIRHLAKEYGEDGIADLLIARRDYIKARFLTATPEVEAFGIASINTTLHAIDSAIVEAIKGIAFRAGKAIEPKDIERVEKVKTAFKGLFAADYMTPATANSITAHYEKTISRLQDAVKQATSPGWAWGQFSGYKGDIKVNLSPGLLNEAGLAAATKDPASYDAASAAKVIGKPKLSSSQRSMAERHGLTDMEIHAITQYTGSFYRLMNNYLREGKAGMGFDLKDVENAVKAASAGLAKLPGHGGNVARGVRSSGVANSDAYIKAHTTEGAVIRWNSFTSASTDELFPGDMRFIIRPEPGSTLPGADVRSISLHGSEAEVLLAPGTIIRVEKVSVRKTTDNKSYYDIEVTAMKRETKPQYDFQEKTDTNPTDTDEAARYKFWEERDRSEFGIGGFTVLSTPESRGEGKGEGQG